MKIDHLPMSRSLEFVTDCQSELMTQPSIPHESDRTEWLIQWSNTQVTTACEFKCQCMFVHRL